MKEKGDRLIALARVGAPHGTRGEVRVFPYAGLESATLRPGLHVTLDLQSGAGEHRTVFLVEQVRRGKRCLLLKLGSIADRTEAERLRGATVLVRKGDLPPLREGEFYYADVLGKDVTLEDGTFLGVVKNIFEAAQDVLEIETSEGIFLVPVVESLVTQIGPQGVVLSQKGLELAVKGRS